jgi:hypothetical protein
MVDYWAVTHINGKEGYQSIHTMRKQSIEWFLEDCIIDWKEAYRLGWRCVKIKITEI